jgi:uncharacterized protein DUF4440
LTLTLLERSRLILAFNLNERINLMKKLITCITTALLATIAISFAAPGDKDTIISKEKAAWQAFKDKKADEFKKLLSTDLVTVYADGMHNLQQEVDSMSKTDMKSFDLSGFNVVFPNPKTAIITYKAKVEATSDGKDVSGTYNVGSVWHMAKGQWVGIFHTDMKEAPPAGQ